MNGIDDQLPASQEVGSLQPAVNASRMPRCARAVSGPRTCSLCSPLHPVAMSCFRLCLPPAARLAPAPPVSADSFHYPPLPFILRSRPLRMPPFLCLLLDTVPFLTTTALRPSSRLAIHLSASVLDFTLLFWLPISYLI